MILLYIWGFFGALWFLIWLYDNWDQTPEGQYRRLLGEFERDADRRGLTYQQRTDELAFRRAMATVREEVNRFAVESPGCIMKDKIAEVAEREARLLACTDKAVARNFLRVVINSPLSDILYADGSKAIIEHGKKFNYIPPKRTITNIDLAALRTK